MSASTPYKAVFAACPLPMWIWDLETGLVLDVNDAALARYGYTRKEFLALRPTDIIVADEGAVITTGSWRHRMRDGRSVELETSSQLMTYAGRSAALVSVRDIAVERAFEEAAHRYALHDALTGLGNRQHLDIRLEEVLSRGDDGRYCALLVLDVEGLRVINAELGREAGDQLLVSAAQRLAHACGEGALFRIGGETFGVLIADVDGVETARERGELLLRALADDFAIAGQTVHVTSHLGIALAEPGCDPDDVIRNADSALQSVKDLRGRRIGVFASDHRELRGQRFAMEMELRRALANGELRVLYQPILDLRRGTISGMEALVRWKHPLRGMLAPDGFISLAERAGLVADIDAWVMATACRQLRAWHQQGLPSVTVSVNLSGRDLDTGPQLVELIRDELTRSELSPERLEVELTESTALHNQEEVKTLLDELRNIGVRIAIDDFGTGYSMLDRIRDLPVDRIKIDRTFVRRVPGNSASLITAVIAMAQSLQLQVTAEGVENEPQLSFLREHGCDHAQGYLIGRPSSPRVMAGALQTPSPLPQTSILTWGASHQPVAH